MTNEKFKPFDMAEGKTKEVHLCSPGKKVTIREITGEDEDILTLVKDQEDGIAIPKFVSKVIVSEQYTVGDIQEWRARDKYLILFEAIRLTYGDTFRFEHKFENGDVSEFEEDISKYVWEFSEEGRESYPKKGDKDFFAERIIPYQGNESGVKFTLSSGKIVGFEYMTGILESASLMIDQKQRSLNDDLRDRNFYLKNDAGADIRIDSFRVLNAREMAEIRNKISEVDPSWPAMITLTNPKNGKTETLSLFSIPDFFFRRLL